MSLRIRLCNHTYILLPHSCMQSWLHHRHCHGPQATAAAVHPPVSVRGRRALYCYSKQCMQRLQEPPCFPIPVWGVRAPHRMSTDGAIPPMDNFPTAIGLAS